MKIQIIQHSIGGGVMLMKKNKINLSDLKVGGWYLAHQGDHNSTFKFKVISEPFLREDDSIRDLKIKVVKEGHDKTQEIFLGDYGIIPYPNGHWNRTNWTEKCEAPTNPLNGSIKKWSDICGSIDMEDNGNNNCALCLEYTSCVGCPVKKYTGETGCRKTPYNLWVSHHIDDHRESGYPFKRVRGCAYCSTLAKAEREFLKMLKGKER